MGRNIGPMVTPAAVIQLVIAALTQAGTGTVRTWPPLPMLFSLLEAFRGQLGYLCPSETASQQNGNHSVVTFSAEAGLIKSGEEALALCRYRRMPPNPRDTGLTSYAEMVMWRPLLSGVQGSRCGVAGRDPDVEPLAMRRALIPRRSNLSLGAIRFSAACLPPSPKTWKRWPLVGESRRHDGRFTTSWSSTA